MDVHINQVQISPSANSKSAVLFPVKPVSGDSDQPSRWNTANTDSRNVGPFVAACEGRVRRTEAFPEEQDESSLRTPFWGICGDL